MGNPEREVRASRTSAPAGGFPAGIPRVSRWVKPLLRLSTTRSNFKHSEKWFKSLASDEKNDKVTNWKKIRSLISSQNGCFIREIVKWFTLMVFSHKCDQNRLIDNKRSGCWWLRCPTVPTLMTTRLARIEKWKRFILLKFYSLECLYVLCVNSLIMTEQTRIF